MAVVAAQCKCGVVVCLNSWFVVGLRNSVVCFQHLQRIEVTARSVLRTTAGCKFLLNDSQTGTSPKVGIGMSNTKIMKYNR